MTTQATAVTLDAIDTALVGAAGSPGEDEQRLAASVLRLLATGEPDGCPARTTRLA